VKALAADVDELCEIVESNTRLLSVIEEGDDGADVRRVACGYVCSLSA